MRPIFATHPLRWTLLVLGLALAALLIFWKLPIMTTAAARHAHPDLLRFTELPAFDPYRKSFECKHEAAVNPPASEAAQALFDQAMALSDWGIPRKERNYAKVASLYRQAMGLGHWKAQFNLAGLYLEGDGVPFNPDEALRLTEDLMRQGVPAAWFNMGNHYMSGTGPLKADATVAYAFWQRAADMGSLHAQALLGDALNADVDEPPKWWNNRAIGRKMLECAFAQGSGEAAYRLGISYENEAESLPDRTQKEAVYAKAVQRYHGGVKFGSQDCANGMFALFEQGAPAVGHAKDPSRARRYSEIGDYLWHHPDTRLPNLDRVLPLPPAKLPTWDSQVESLIRAAQPVRPVPQPSAAASAAARAPGRARVPLGFAVVLPDELQNFAQRPIVGYHGILSPSDERMGLKHAPMPGYYQPIHIWATRPPERMPTGGHQLLRMQALAEVPPLYYRAGEPLNLRGAYTPSLDFHFSEEADHGVIYWRFVGQGQATEPLMDHLARAGLVRAIAQAQNSRCSAGAACPHSGISQPELSGHDAWRYQAFVQQGQAMPTPAGVGDAEAAQVRWRLMQACEPGFEVAA